MALFLRDGEVSEAIGMDEMLEAIETMQRHFGQGEAYNLPRRKIIAEGGMLSVMGGGLYYDDVLGVKTYTVVRGAYSFQVSLYDANTGSLLLYTQANRLGQLRTRSDYPAWLSNTFPTPARPRWVSSGPATRRPLS